MSAAGRWVQHEVTMKSVAGLAIAVFVLLSAPWLRAQTLADVARQTRDTSRPRAARVITNDDISPADSMRSTDAAKSSDSKADASKDSKADSKKDAPKSESGKTDTSQKGEAKAESGKTPSEPKNEAERLREQQELIDKFSRQLEKVSLIERDIKLSQREREQLSLIHNNDVNARVNSQSQWATSENRFQSELSDKQDKLNAARQKLEEMQEEARRAGAKLPD